MFADRSDAGERLAERLASEDVSVDLVLAIPRGGLPLGRAVADALDVPLDVVVAKKLGAPRNPEFAIGAVASDGSTWYNEDAIDRLGVSGAYVRDEWQEQTVAARQKAATYRQGKRLGDLDGQAVAVVDDGVATGSTARACLRQVREAGADPLIFAVPVGPSDTVAELGAEADRVICLDTPPDFRAVGQYYRSFEQVPDEEALTYLDRDEAKM
ncbi:phosphoribosyltransferase [Halorientalis sp. IM1011]|uniref:phosphoribosyltransferase n=1 Tax=Halorientalis sp. IM1011 TaxID=1932360 RepID=UPI00097CC967|nr:phosphoribosyltransferase family protein [Halorientalis sp. IM1011]AQL42227.1 phosphoribosyltransferase [Halorientalis sp. IM1011]